MLKVLRAHPSELCQADPDELLVPNPLIMEDEDNDYFIGVFSRRPSRLGRVVEEDESLASLLAADRQGILGPESDDDADEDADPDDEEAAEREDDVRFLLEFVQDLNVGTLVTCRYTLDGDDINWEMVEV